MKKQIVLVVLTTLLLLLFVSILLFREIRTRKKLQKELRVQQKADATEDIICIRREEQRLAKAIIETQEKERLHIGQELHDNVNQILASAQIILGSAEAYYPDVEKINELVEMGRCRVSEAINEIRKLSHRLAPAIFDGSPLKDIFLGLLYRIDVQNQYTIHFEFDERLNHMTSETIIINLYRIMQEQLANIAKYAKAKHITVVLKNCGNNIYFRIQDDGRGFDMRAANRGIGLNNIRKRVDALAGKFILNTAPGKGCTIIAEIPM